LRLRALAQLLHQVNARYTLGQWGAKPVAGPNQRLPIGNGPRGLVDKCLQCAAFTHHHEDGHVHGCQPAPLAGSHVGKQNVRALRQRHRQELAVENADGIEHKQESKGVNVKAQQASCLARSGTCQ
jgi:hypothetical protein